MLKTSLKSPKKCNHAQSKMERTEAIRNSAMPFVDINVYVSPECHCPWTLTLELPILGVVVVMAEAASPLLTDDSVQCSAERRAAVLQCCSAGDNDNCVQWCGPG